MRRFSLSTLTAPTPVSGVELGQQLKSIGALDHAVWNYVA